MKSEIQNRIIIIGGNHLNTLSVVRCLGECQCNLNVLIHTDDSLDKLNCANSRYGYKKTFAVPKNEESIISWLIKHKTDKKQILFPCSDFAAYVIDKNATRLNESFYLPGFKGQPNKVCELMSKWEQKKLADKIGVPMANSWFLSEKVEGILPENVCFPCILKPNKSAFGVKSDITICENKDSLELAVNKLGITYKEGLLLQEFIKKDFEYDSIGCIVEKREDCVVNIIRKIYDLSGNTVFAQFDENPLVAEVNIKIIDVLHEMGYRGMFDIEYIVAGTDVYLIEINFRHSGVGFGLIKSKVYAPMIWCLDICGKREAISEYEKKVKIGKYMMDETVCFNHRAAFGLSLKKWMKLCFMTDAFAKISIKDIRGTCFLYGEIIRKRYHRRRHKE